LRSHAPWQRGSNENTNGLLRQFVPKATNLGDASQTWLNDVAALMSNRPRKTIGWKTPAEAMADELAAFRSTVALETGIQVLQVPIRLALRAQLRPHASWPQKQRVAAFHVRVGYCKRCSLYAQGLT